MLSCRAAISGKSAMTLKTVLKKQSQFPEREMNVSATLTTAYVRQSLPETGKTKPVKAKRRPTEIAYSG
jgi:hypothetical protein